MESSLLRRPKAESQNPGCSGNTNTYTYVASLLFQCPANVDSSPMIQKASTIFKSSSTNSNLIDSCKTLNQFKQLHAHLLKSQLQLNQSVIDPIFTMAATSNDPCLLSYACSIFRHHTRRSTFMYNNMIRIYIQSRLPVYAVLCYLEMLNYGLMVNKYTFPPLIKACSQLGKGLSKSVGLLVHAHLVVFGFSHDPFVGSALIELYSSRVNMESARKLFDRMPERDVVLWTTMVDGYGKSGDVENARKLFEDMPDRNAVSWSAIMAAFSRLSDFKEVLRLFGRMQETGVRPNESGLVSVITACARLGSLGQGSWVHSYAKRWKYDSNNNSILATALVDMYCKCGNVEEALSVFEGIPRKDPGAWNAIICGLAVNGEGRKSLQLFNRMALSGTKPNETTFIAILTACTHAKLVNEGLKLFEEMENLYQVNPRLEHYACVVDLLARSGMVEEAEKFIEEKMGGLEAAGDVNVWGALLGACRVYGKVDIGNRVWTKLLADNRVPGCGARVISYSIYREAGRGKEAESVRRSISALGLKKKPGCSVIEVDGKCITDKNDNETRIQSEREQPD
ncbi:hypothetical protein Dimus_034382 [Dionaea muscipula]